MVKRGALALLLLVATPAAAQYGPGAVPTPGNNAPALVPLSPTPHQFVTGFGVTSMGVLPLFGQPAFQDLLGVVTSNQLPAAPFRVVTGDGVTTAFTFAAPFATPFDSSKVNVAFDGIAQNPASYTVTATGVTFSAGAPPAGVRVVTALGAIAASVAPTTAATASRVVTGDGVTTAFTFAAPFSTPFDATKAVVTIGGLAQDPASFATTTTGITFNAGAPPTGTRVVVTIGGIVAVAPTTSGSAASGSATATTIITYTGTSEVDLSANGNACLNGPTQVDLEPSPTIGSQHLIIDCRANPTPTISIVSADGTLINGAPTLPFSQPGQAANLIYTALGWRLF